MNKNLIIVFLIGLVLFTSCQKDVDQFIPDAGQLNGPDSNWYASIIPTMPINDVKSKLGFPTIKDSFQMAASAVTVSTPNGLQCTFPALGLETPTGQPITGKVKVELMYLRSKGDMVRLGRPTTSNGRLLVASGGMFVRVSNDTAELQFTPSHRMTLRYTESPLNTQMKFFVGDEGNVSQFNWLPNPDNGTNVVGFNTTNSQYEVQTNRLRWTGTEYFYDTTNISRVTLKVQTANYFTNANTVAYTVFRDFKSVVGMYGDVNSRKFVSSTKLPVNKLATVIVISKQGNDYFMGYENVTTAAQSGTQGEQTVTVTPIKRSMSDILSFLNTL
jgi:hypothetical protein